jgi:cold-inducible RNA-binding protein
MKTKLYVGNLSYNTTEDSVKAFFEKDGMKVTSTTVISDRVTGQSRGFGFVEMGSPEDAEKAVKTLDGQELDGRAIRVSEAREREGGGGGGRSRGPRGGGYGGGGYDR